MINHGFNDLGFQEGTAFEGLMPKAMDILGDKYCVGTNENQPVVSIFDSEANGPDQMKVVSVYDITTSEKSDEEGE